MELNYMELNYMEPGEFYENRICDAICEQSGIH